MDFLIILKNLTTSTVSCVWKRGLECLIEVIQLTACSKEAHTNPGELQKLAASKIQDGQTAWQLAAEVSNVRVNGSCGRYRLLFFSLDEALRNWQLCVQQCHCDQYTGTSVRTVWLHAT